MSTLEIVWSRVKAHPLSRVGPGLITGVADDDPSGIATYSQAGAQFGLNMLWTMPLAFPLMAAIQLMCADIGRVTGKGIAANIKTAFPPVVLRGVVLLLLVANTLNIAADIAAMGETAELVIGFDRCRRYRIAASLRSISPIGVLSEVAYAIAAGLRGRAVHGSCPVGRSRTAHCVA
jgi:Mn2+/Fe2+ NRAMP family transporter